MGRPVSAGGALALFGLTVVAIFACRYFTSDPDQRQRAQELAESRRRKLERQQWEKLERERLIGELRATGKHIHQVPVSLYKPAAAYLAPEKPQPVRPANVLKIRGKR